MAEDNTRNWQTRLHEIVYESNTAAGKAFDVGLLILILTSVGVIMLDSVPRYHKQYGEVFLVLEWSYTILFTIEYILRLMCIQKPWGYVFSTLGIIDLVAILPTYLSFIYPGSHSLLVVRALRLMRIFRIFKLSHFMYEMQFLGGAIKGSLRKISIFMLVVVTLVVIFGSIMYLIEKGENGFHSIPDSIYWAIVTITTVGYGDISPATPLGKFVASIIMLMGYAIIAVPTGILTTEMALAARRRDLSNEACPNCGREGHDKDAKNCKYCGAKL